ncbi:MAG: glycoside hydrolase family 16 protein [Planctomycetaceae bacterium]|jgi:beta-glucanase (GH16 family)|nr:glycoside hydrolase family 16 protein [Planctomycetaceae bacterium]
MKRYLIASAIIILLPVSIFVLRADESQSGQVKKPVSELKSAPSITASNSDGEVGEVGEVGSKLSSGWRLVWEENFDGNDFDVKRWSKIPRGNADWEKHMSDFGGCYEVKDGNLILRGLRNEKLPKDKSPYLTGGIYTKDKVNFGKGRIEICAKLNAAKGAWPAFWMLPADKKPWPSGGEIDIMERLNNDNFVHQTIHSAYTHDPKNKKPASTAKGKIKPNDYNIYAVELYEDKLVFFVNGKKTFTYPRIKTDDDKQFPFNREYYLLLDMQLGGSWVGEINPNDLPVEMKIDWVRFYKKN